MNLALFDFDGTITTEDTYTKFIFFVSSKLRVALCLALVWPVIILYRCRLLSARATRAVISWVAFWRTDVEAIAKLADSFNTSYLTSVIRPNALSRIQWHKARGDDVVVVSASINSYLEIWCKQHDVKLLCTRLKSVSGKYTGRYMSGECSGKHKARMVKQFLNLSHYDEIYAYGDTDEDLPMLELATIKYFRWQHIQQDSGRNSVGV